MKLPCKLELDVIEVSHTPHLSVPATVEELSESPSPSLYTPLPSTHTHKQTHSRLYEARENTSRHFAILKITRTLLDKNLCFDRLKRKLHQ